MVRIGLRQIRQNASAYLRRVEAGETIQIAVRGRPVAVWAPVRTQVGLERLLKEMRISEPEEDLLDLGPPLPPTRGKESPSRRLARARRHER